MSETLRLIALLAPIALATLVTSLLARRLVTRAGLAYTLIAIAVIASLVTVVDLLVLSHFMLINAGQPRRARARSRSTRSRRALRRR